jgi:hypothetical protein
MGFASVFWELLDHTLFVSAFFSGNVLMAQDFKFKWNSSALFCSRKSVIWTSPLLCLEFSKFLSSFENSWASKNFGLKSMIEEPEVECRLLWDLFEISLIQLLGWNKSGLNNALFSGIFKLSKQIYSQISHQKYVNLDNSNYHEL